jgi:hypothetical protein
MKFSLCNYKEMFGKPNEGVHKYRLFDVAIVDVMLTIMVGYIIAKYFKLSFIWTLLCLFLLSIVLHRIFCVRTRVDRLLFPD